MTTQEFHRIIRSFIKKEIDGWTKPADIDIAADRAQMALFNDYYGNIRAIDPATGRPVLGYGQIQRLNDALSPFKGKLQFIAADTPGGMLTLPDNYMYLISLMTTQFNNSLGRNVTTGVSIINEEELQDRLESQVVAVALDGPIAIVNSGKKIQIFPEIGQSGTAYYFRRPAAPVFAYTQVGREITYDPATSVDLEWNEQEINNIISKTLENLGVPLSSAELVGFGSQKNKEGQ